MTEISIDKIFEIGIAISAEKDRSKLFSLILNSAMNVTESDAGTLYILEEDKLLFNYMITRSKGIDSSANRGEINIPPVPLGRGHVCACCALDKKIINITDIYKSNDYDFSGAQTYDNLNDYKTKSMLVAPMLDEDGECIGVVQLINGDFPPFAERMIMALASFAAISLNNKLLTEEVNNLLHSIVRMMVSAIDARSPYNANHTKTMVYYGERFLEYVLENDTDFKIKKEDIEPLLMSIWLHDIGKLVIPLEVMDKSTRLGDRYNEIMHKITVGILMTQIKALEDPKKSSLYKKQRQELIDCKNIVSKANTSGFLTDELTKEIKGIADTDCMDENGNYYKLFTNEEIDCLLIKRGTLTDNERKIIESHVAYTKRMLDELAFSKKYKKLPFIAGSHHECLDGSGYPEGITKEKIPQEVRLLSIIDVYDALTAEDRPYKPPMSPDKAFVILKDMADNGKLDKNILELFIKSRAWEKQ